MTSEAVELRLVRIELFYAFSSPTPLKHVECFFVSVRAKTNCDDLRKEKTIHQLACGHACMLYRSGYATMVLLRVLLCCVAKENTSLRVCDNHTSPRLRCAIPIVLIIVRRCPSFNNPANCLIMV